MIANCAFLALLVMLLTGFWLMSELEFLAPYRHVIVRNYLWVVVGAVVVVFVNLFGIFYLAARSLFLKDTGRKLAHVDKLLKTPDTVVRDLSDRLSQEE